MAQALAFATAAGQVGVKRRPTGATLRRSVDDGRPERPKESGR